MAEAGLGAGNTVDGVQLGLGMTGSITKVSNPRSSKPRQARVVEHLPSAAEDEGGGPEAIGVDGLSFFRGKLYGIIGASGIPGTDFGKLVEFSCATSGRRCHLPPVKPLADVGSSNLAFTEANQGQPWAGAEFPDSNPYNLLVDAAGRYVVDAGANTLNRIDADGSVHVLAYIPGTPFSDAVPTCVTRGPDGALYIGTLALLDLFIDGPGHSKVYRVDPRTAVPDDLGHILTNATVWASGFTTITGCTFDRKGNFYAVEMFMGDVQVVPFRHPDTGRTILGEGILTLPNGIAVANDGTVYVSNMSSNPNAGAGSVVRITRG